MRRALPLALLLAAGCDDTELPPGRILGTFSFEAELAPEAPGSCAFAGVPRRLAFEGILSHEPETGEAWMQIDGTLRHGELGGADFVLGLEPLPDGSVRTIPRRLPTCSCELLLVETIRGRLVRTLGDCEEDPVEEEPGAATCPRLDEAGALDWDTCGAVCGAVEERVRFTTDDCTCEVDGADVPAPAEGCTFFYAMQGTRIGS